MDGVLSALVSLATLTFLESVLGFDNVLMVGLNVNKLPPRERPRARTIGMTGAMVMRIALLCSLNWVMGLTSPIIVVLAHPVSWRDLILIVGGAFLVWKATHEIYGEVEGDGHHGHGGQPERPVSFRRVIGEIMVLDIIFSLDSVITAVGMAQNLAIMITAVVLSMAIMMKFAAAIGDFISRHASFKVLALTFLVLIGVFLVIEGAGQHVSKGYIYIAMVFAFAVELLHMRRRSKAAQRAAATRAAQAESGREVA
ncbi:MAG: Integral membrane protein TerC [Candidatus Magasanikbacteria bacterium GW2011_GWA2_56_11]|uniref:Integral membrane protein TerC n=1 Tax=Candidatus Magasanikbacteria bacterium GW2011_GWA2_56_11 TaxID=1619044 RepID=A0A0G1YFB3_9BACT|nr:MAG: Integral membrane protein TerC [Candidatus Magasanikbacteria bacterium GW2011_GWA2_56_11]